MMAAEYTIADISTFPWCLVRCRQRGKHDLISCCLRWAMLGQIPLLLPTYFVVDYHGGRRMIEVRG